MYVIEMYICSSVAIAAHINIILSPSAFQHLQCFSGLYNPVRGPHTFWLRNGSVDANADGFINMLHYEDAAEACVAALTSSKKFIELICNTICQDGFHLFL